jgi:hypothetical protein
VQLVRLLGAGAGIIGGCEGSPGLAEVTVPGQGTRPDRMQPDRPVACREVTQAVLRELSSIGIPAVPDRRPDL